jgi:hypothetical protein
MPWEVLPEQASMASAMASNAAFTCSGSAYWRSPRRRISDHMPAILSSHEWQGQPAAATSGTYLSSVTGSMHVQKQLRHLCAI